MGYRILLEVANAVYFSTSNAYVDGALLSVEEYSNCCFLIFT